MEFFNNFFLFVCNVYDIGYVLLLMYLFCNNKLLNIVINEEEIIDIILILLVNKVIGFDNISYKMFKFIKFIIFKFLCFLFNRLLFENKFLKNWKFVYVILLFKKDDFFVVFNYRFVLLLSCVSKLMECLIFKYVYNFFYCNNLFYKY